jgi:hypothetical protein
MICMRIIDLMMKEKYGPIDRQALCIKIIKTNKIMSNEDSVYLLVHIMDPVEINTMHPLMTCYKMKWKWNSKSNKRGGGR